MNQKYIESEFMMQGQENFYLISMNGNNSMIKVYDSTTRLRICRRIALPEGIPICCQNYLIIHNAPFIYLIDVININAKEYKCRNEGIKQITKAIFNVDLNIFLLVDGQNHLYYMHDNNNELVIKAIYKAEKPPVSKLYSDKQGNIWLFFQSKEKLLKLKFNWKDDKLQDEEVFQGIFDVYYQYGWSAIIERRQENKFRLSINNEQYVQSLEYSDYFLMKANFKQFLYIDLSSSKVIAICDGLIIPYTHDLPILNIRKGHKLVFNLETLSQKYCKLTLYDFDEIQQKFQPVHFHIPLYEGKDNNLYIFNNLPNIIKDNGLIYHHYIGNVMSFLQENHVNLPSYEDLQNLTCKLLQSLFYINPEATIRFARGLETKRKDSYVLTSFLRFVQYVEQILQNVSLYLQKCGENKGQQINQDKLTTLRTAINFTSILEQIVWQEVYDYKTEAIFDRKFLNSDKEKVKRFTKIIQHGKSLYLIGSMLKDENFFEKAKYFFYNSQTSKNKGKQYYMHQDQWKRNYLIPNLLCQYFSNSFPSTVEEVLVQIHQNQYNYHRIAYYYASIIQSFDIPYLTNDASKKMIQFLASQPLYSDQVEIQQKVREQLPKIASRALLLDDQALLRYLCQLSIFYEEYKTCLCILLSQKLYEHERQEKVLAYYVLCDRVLLGYEMAQSLIIRRQLENERVMREFGRICERNSKLKELFQIKNGVNKDLIFDEIKQERGDEVEEIRQLFQNY